jgi:lipopolysaccharide export system permease protein
MDTLDRFLLKEFVSYFLFILVGLAVLYLGIDFLTHFWDYKMPFSRVMAVYGYKLPAALQQFVPVACLMATLLVLTHMSRQNEILALYSSGIGTLRLVSTFVAITATLSTFSFLTFDSLVPIFTKKGKLAEKGLSASQEYILSSETRTGLWYRSGQLIYNVGRFVPDTNMLEDIHIYVLNSQFHLDEVVRANRATFNGNDWILHDGFSVAYPNQFPIATAFKDRRGMIPERPNDFRTLKVQEETMRLKDLRHYIVRNQRYGLDTTAQQVNYHERLSLVFTPLVFVLIGIPFATKPLRSYSMGKSVAFCFAVVFLYLLMSRLSLSIGKGGHLPPVVAGWAPNLLFLSLAGLFIVKR